MFLGQTVGRGRDPCPLPGSRQARGQGSVVVPTPGWPGRAPADRSPQGGEAAGGGRLLGLYVSRWASGPAGFGDSFRTVSIFWPLEQRPGGPPPLVPGVCGAQPGGRRGGAGRWGSAGPAAGQVGVSPSQDGGAGVECRGQAEPPTPQRPQASAMAGSHVGGGVGGLALPGGLGVAARAWESESALRCPLRPPRMSLSGWCPASKGPGDPSPNLPDLGESVRGPQIAQLGLRGEGRASARSSAVGAPSPEPEPPSPSPRALCPRCPALRSRD